MTDKSTQNSPRRYTISGLHPHIYENKDGSMVYYEDYAILKGEVERVRMEQKLKAIPVEAKLIDRIAELKAEVEFWKSASTDNGIACNQRANENQGLENEIARLKTELTNLKSTADRFKAEVESLMTNPTSRLLRAERDENARLKAEVERLTKAIMDSVEMRQRLREIEEGKQS
jgi:chromosome segregation ATPase